MAHGWVMATCAWLSCDEVFSGYGLGTEQLGLGISARPPHLPPLKTAHSIFFNLIFFNLPFCKVEVLMYLTRLFSLFGEGAWISHTWPYLVPGWPLNCESPVLYPKFWDCRWALPHLAPDLTSKSGLMYRVQGGTFLFGVPLDCFAVCDVAQQRLVSIPKGATKAVLTNLQRDRQVQEGHGCLPG